MVNSLLTPVNDALAKETAWLEASGTARAAVRDTNTPIREMLNRYRAATGFTEGMENAWQISSHATQYDMNTHYPTVTAKARPGMVEIGGKKPGFTAMDIQARVDGTETWETIGAKVNQLLDTRPSANGKPEKRECRGLGYDGDQQVGQPSPIVTAIWGV